MNIIDKINHKSFLTKQLHGATLHKLFFNKLLLKLQI